MVFSQGKRRRVGGITVLWTRGRPEVRIGLVTSRRVGKAVARNRAKRRLRAALAQIDPVSDGDYVIVATRQVAEAPFLKIVGWLKAALGQGR